MGVLWTSTSPTASWKRPVGRVGVNAGATFTTLHKLRASGASTTPSGILFGSSPGGGGSSTMNQMVGALGPAIVRTYDSGLAASFSSTTMGQYVPAGTPQHFSIKPDLPNLATMAVQGTTAYNNLVNALRAYMATVPDIPGMRCSLNHEPYHNNVNAANWSQSQANFKTDVLNVVNGPRSNNILLNICIEGFTLGASFTAAFNSYFTATAIAAADEFGFDCYQGNQQDLGASYAASKGKPWSIPEYGQIAGGTGADVSDANALAYMQANVPRLSTLSNPPTNVCWFNGNGSQITGSGGPGTQNAANYWQSIT